MDNNISNRVHKSLRDLLTCIAALTFTTLIWGCVYVFSVVVSVAILVVFSIISVLLCKFLPGSHELDLEIRERTVFIGQTPQYNKRVVRIFDELFWVVEERGGNRRQQGSVKKLLGSVVCFGSQAMPSYPSGCSDCAICLEDFKEGEECLVLPICEHLFHFICIHRWLENKHTCPICRHCIPSAATMITRTRSIELLANLV